MVEKFERESAVNGHQKAPLDEETPASDAAARTAAPRERSFLGQLAALWQGKMARTTLVLWVLWFILTGVNYGFTSWLPAMLVAAKGFTITKSFLSHWSPL